MGETENTFLSRGQIPVTHLTQVSSQCLMGNNESQHFMTHIPGSVQPWLAVISCVTALKRIAALIKAGSWNCTLKRQKRRGLKLSFPLRSSRERNSISWSINSGSEKYSKTIFSPWVKHKGNTTCNNRTAWLKDCVWGTVWTHTSLISSYCKSSFGFSEAAWIIIFLRGVGDKEDAAVIYR